MTAPTRHTNHENIKELFSTALDLGPELREAYLDKNCDSGATRDEVESLLRARHDAGPFLEGISAANVIQNSYQKTASEKLIGELIDEYRIVREIGRGGMGVVFLAVRETFHQQVAIKIIKRGMDSDAIVERFFRERQIMAALNHPFIAKLLDGGTTADDLPYFVMEYVDGISISEFCRELSETEVLILFRKVCSAVSFAHEKLIVHRDLKPSNILVNADGEPKLLDFGIAKLLDDTDARETQTQHRVLTPAYASPEQIGCAIVGTASDVYSLGKILAELLDCSDGNPSAPESDSRPVMAPPHNKRTLRPDLRNILAMALRVDVSRRYGSVERFSDDIRRFLEDLPVSARRDSFSYRTQKFIKRNRLKLAFAGLLALTLAGGMIATVWKANEASRERELAEKRFEGLRKLSDSFVTELHAAIQNLPGSLPARQLLLRRATEQLDALAADAGENRVLQDELAGAYTNLATLPDMSLDEKESTYTKAVAIYQNLLQTEPENALYQEQIALAYVELGDTEKVRGSVAKGLSYSNAAVTILEKVSAGDPNDISKLKNLHLATSNSVTYYTLEGEANASLLVVRREQKIVEQMRKLSLPVGEADQFANRSHLQLGAVLTSLGDYKIATSELQMALDGFSIEQAKNPNDTSINYYLWSVDRRLATAVELDGDANKGLEYAQKSLAIIEGLMATSRKDIGYHRNSAITHILLGQMLVRRNNAAQAVTHFRRALELSQEVLVTDPQYFESKFDMARSLGNLGSAMIANGNKAEGLAHLREAVKIYDEMTQVDTENAVLKRDYAESMGWLGSALETTDKAKSAEFYRASYALWNDLRSKEKLSAADIDHTKEI